jgi:hypothetical protein
VTPRPQFSSASRFTAGAAGYLILSQWGERPERLFLPGFQECLLVTSGSQSPDGAEEVIALPIFDGSLESRLACTGHCGAFESYNVFHGHFMGETESPSS